jgi:hypothetical protein
VDDAQALWEQMDEYEQKLYEDGCTLEQINWYHQKRREYRSHELMMAEYPSTAGEAFTATGFNPFPTDYLDRLEEGCSMEPLLVGDIQGEGLSGNEAKIREWEFEQAMERTRRLRPDLLKE